MFDWLTQEISNSPWTYLLVFVAAGGDVLLPLIPSEAVVIAAGVVTARGGLSLWLLIPATMAGAMVGDNAAYWLGRRAGDPIVHRVMRGEQGQGRLRWAERAMRRHGSVVLVAARFIPGGRTVSTLAAGTLELPWRIMLAADAVAALLWALYATMLGYLGGETFQHSSWKPIVLALGVALLVSAVVELWRRRQRRRGLDVLGDPIAGCEPRGRSRSAVA
jgi:membrane protein DedA with SNARE-associated domain